jgi:hypothetical protein
MFNSMGKQHHPMPEKWDLDMYVFAFGRQQIEGLESTF